MVSVLEPGSWIHGYVPVDLVVKYAGPDKFPYPSFLLGIGKRGNQSHEGLVFVCAPDMGVFFCGG